MFGASPIYFQLVMIAENGIIYPICTDYTKILPTIELYDEPLMHLEQSMPSALELPNVDILVMFGASWIYSQLVVIAESRVMYHICTYYTIIYQLLGDIKNY
jgi:hypothetical protein